MFKALLPPKKSEDPDYTLVVDLDETLIHFNEKIIKTTTLKDNNKVDEYFNI